MAVAARVVLEILWVRVKLAAELRRRAFIPVEKKKGKFVENADETEAQWMIDD